MERRLFIFSFVFPSTDISVLTVHISDLSVKMSAEVVWMGQLNTITCFVVYIFPHLRKPVKHLNLFPKQLS